MAQLTYRRDELGRLTEVPPEVLDCGHRFGRGRVVVGFEEHPQRSGQRVRCYYCRECGAVTFVDE